MQSENFDDKIRKAAEQHHPNYDEKAWSKMEKLLDQHMPKKDDRRRLMFLVFLFLLTGGGAWLFLSKPWNEKGQDITVKQSTDKIATKPSARADEQKTSAPVQESTAVIEASPNANKTDEATAANDNVKRQKGHEAAVGNPGAENPSARQKNDRKDDQLTIDVADPSIGSKNNNPPARNDNAVVSAPLADKLAKNTDVVSDNKTNEPVKEKQSDQQQKTNQKVAASKGSIKKHNSFFFSFSAGPDVSSVEMHDPGKVKLLTGAGVGFSFRDRWAIRSGFYSSRKIYTANKYDYKPPTPIVNSTYLDQIDADCKVYEIPLNLSYNFSRSEKHSLFATVGLSSFIMKKEVYKYQYKYPGNPPVTYTYTKTINNENKHYFSVLTLSGGYGYRINKTLSFSAEPYIKIPLAGVGFGKVKLNSGGVLFSANIRPFH